LRPKIAVVVQRYGPDIVGGAESHARQIAERLSGSFEVEVLTSCATDYRCWTDHFSVGESELNGVRIRRFAHPTRGSSFARRTPLSVKWRAFQAERQPEKQPWVHEGSSLEHSRDLRWLQAQGPYCVDLEHFLIRQRRDYAAVLAFSLRFWPTVIAARTLGEQCVLIPTLHHEKTMFRTVFRDAMSRVAHIAYNTAAERELAHRLYGMPRGTESIVGVGIDLARPGEDAIDAIRRQHSLDGEYVVYTGRINACKGCDRLIHAVRKLRASGTTDLRLVLLGEREMPLPAETWLYAPGRLENPARDALVAGAKAFVQPSAFESLSLSTLEAMALGTPVIVNGRSPVLAAHVRDSGTGFAFDNDLALQEAIVAAQNLSREERETHRVSAQRYVDQHYRWSKIQTTLHTIIEEIRTNSERSEPRPGASP
jgi:glycosyltransferase involved in cell wall biosynthesis